MSERVAFVQALKQPDEIGVSANHFRVAPDGTDFVVAVLEEEHALLFVEHGDRDILIHALG